MPRQKQEANSGKTRDYSARLSSFMVGWGIPILAILSLNFLRPGITVSTLVIMAAFTWMGAGCLINSKRCKRRHCYYSGPVFLVGTALVGLVGFGLIDFGRDGLSYAVWGTLAAVGLTFVPEFIWGKYRT